MGIRFYIIFFLTIFFTNADAQVRCGTAELHSQKLATDAQYRAFYENMHVQMQQVSAEPEMQQRSTTATIVIPVVVHVLWNTSGQNISDAQIQSQIAVLNEDFGGYNTDQNQIPSTFKSKFGDADIYFCLATRKPNGDWTTGIERRQISTNSVNMNDPMIKSTALGGLDAWNRNQYLNIWVCNLGGSILGYTEMPGGPASEDGTVIQYNAFGRTGTLLAKYNKGRTATHEIGHWLGLVHIWGDDGGSCSGSDYISDTPNQADATYGCPAYPKTDGCTASPPGVMYMNFMDYTDDACMHMFTAGQTTWMRSILNNQRTPLLSSPGCTAPTAVNTINAETYISVYPNPAGDNLNVDFHFAPGTVQSVTVLDLLGKTIKTVPIDKFDLQTLNIDVSSFSTGLYTLMVNTNEGAVARRFTVAQ